MERGYERETYRWTEILKFGVDRRYVAMLYIIFLIKKELNYA